MDDEIDMDEAAQVCLLNTLQPGGSLVAAGKKIQYQQNLWTACLSFEGPGLSVA